MCRLTGLGGLSGNLYFDRFRTNGFVGALGLIARTDRDKQDGQDGIVFILCMFARFRPCSSRTCFDVVFSSSSSLPASDGA